MKQALAPVRRTPTGSLASFAIGESLVLKHQPFVRADGPSAERDEEQQAFVGVYGDDVDGCMGFAIQN